MAESPHNEMQTVSSAASQRSVWPRLGKLLAVAAGVGLLWFLGRTLGRYIPAFTAWVDSLGFWAPLVFVIGYTVATVAFVPGFLLTLAAGAIFGLLRGTGYVFVGATLGSTLAFLTARYLARSVIEDRLERHPRFAAIDRAVAGEGFKIVFLLRLSPIFPYNLLNYALGLTNVKLGQYVAAAVGMLPATFLYVYYGKALGSLAAVAGGAEVDRGSGYWIFLSFGLIATVLVTAIVTRLARRSLKEDVAGE